LTAAELLEHVLAAVQTFSGGHSQTDDQTIVVLKVQ